MNIAFGISQLQKETPQIVKWIYKTVQFLSVIFGIFVLYLPIPTSIQLDINTGLLISNKLISVIANFFGVPDPENSQSLPNFSTIMTAPVTPTGTIVEPEITNINGVN